jgi:hypothetical protein
MSERLNEVKYTKNVGLAHEDTRRALYDPERLSEGLSYSFVPNNIIAISQDGLELGKHFHDYHEFFFTPTGEFDMRLVDMTDLQTARYTLKKGDRLFIPQGIGHIVTGRRGDVLMCFGTVPFDPKRLIPCSKEALEKLVSMA